MAPHPTAPCAPVNCAAASPKMTRRMLIRHLQELWCGTAFFHTSSRERCAPTRALFHFRNMAGLWFPCSETICGWGRIHLQRLSRSRAETSVHSRRRAPHRLRAPVRDDAQQPLCGPKAKRLEPRNRKHSLRNPDREHNRHLISPVHLSEKSKPVPVENGRADQSLQEIVTECGSSDRRNHLASLDENPRCASSAGCRPHNLLRSRGSPSS